MPDGAQGSSVIAETGNLIFQKMPMILAEIGAIGKDKTNVQQKFKYRGIDDCYLAIHGLLAKHKVFMTAEILNKSREERRTPRSDGTTSVLAFTCLTMRFRFHAEDGSSVPTEAEGEGMDSGDKSSNKAMSVAQKYALIQAFCIPTEDIADSDADSHSVEPRKSQSEQDEAYVAGASDWIKSQKSADVISKGWAAELNNFLNLPPTLQARLQAVRDETLRALANPTAATETDKPDEREAWANKSITWITGQTSMEAVATFWKTNAALIKGLAPYQLAPLEKAKEAAKRRLSGMSAPVENKSAPIILNDEIPF